MESTAAIICVFLTLVTYPIGTQKLSYTVPYNSNQVCPGIALRFIVADFKRLENCTVIHGNLQLMVMERTKTEDYQKMSFPMLREVTGYVMIYRLRGLQTLGNLFPNLTRIRGEEVFRDFSFILYDVLSLLEVGLYSLAKIDRGGVIVWGGLETCHLDTVDWKTIAPLFKHVMLPIRRKHSCNDTCNCGNDKKYNHCWNNQTCQRYLEGPKAQKCHEQCYGCSVANENECSLCRHYTYRGNCVSACPNNTILLQINKYCLSIDECNNLGGWLWKNKCVFKCPKSYEKIIDKGGYTTCQRCEHDHCQKVCKGLIINSVREIQAADGCSIINGSLIINIRTISEVLMAELRLYMNSIEEINDYLLVHGSSTINTLNFFSSLKIIHGRKLKSDKFSLLVYDMANLQTLFSNNVTEKLQIKKGSFRAYKNPVLCYNELEKIRPKFPIKPSDVDIPKGMNGYISVCKEVSIDLQIQVTNETSALVMFPAKEDPTLHFTLLYVKVPPGTDSLEVVPEGCCENEWKVISVPTMFGHVLFVHLDDLQPASTYALCVETESVDPDNIILARSQIYNFSTPAGKPPPPFISKLAADSSEVIFIEWNNHIDYAKYITHYELYVTLIYIDPKDTKMRDHCKEINSNIHDQNHDESRHFILMKPPPNYDYYCDSRCGIEGNFDICYDLEKGNNFYDEEIVLKHAIEISNDTRKIRVEGDRIDYAVDGLIPYRDYRFILRACSHTKCSGPARGVVRTLPARDADIAEISSAFADTKGNLNIKWETPFKINGIVLAYVVHIVLNIHETDRVPMPSSICTTSDDLVMNVKLEPALSYDVKICTLSLATITCNNYWRNVKVRSNIVDVVFDDVQMWYVIWGSGICLAIILCISTLLIGRYYRQTVNNTDNIPLIDMTSANRNESYPPGVSMSDLSLIPSTSYDDEQ